MNDGHIFAETYALCREPMMVDAVAASNCEILFLNLKVLQKKTALLPGIRKYNAAFLQCAAAKI